MRVVADIETDALDATVIHCIVCKDIDTGTRWSFFNESLTDFKEFAKDVDHWIGHNFLSFDAPVLNRLMGTSISPKQVTDTLILSQMDKPDREGGHSLKSWGERIRDNKIEFKIFDYFSQEMLDYCIQDVDLCHKVYKHLVKKLSNYTCKSIRMEHTIRYIVNEQQSNGFAFKFSEANIFKSQLTEAKIEVEQEVHKTMRPVASFVKEVTPVYNKDGRLSKRNLKLLGDMQEYVGGLFSLIKFDDFNLGSRQQIAKQLIRKGWEPTKFTEKGSIIVDESVLEEVHLPEAQMIYRYLMLQKRIAQIDNWLKAYNYDSGCIHGRVITLGANTNRMTHMSPNVAQTPASYSPYGKECRELFTVRSDDRVLVGCDASGLELRCLAHYMNDTQFTKELLEGDIHTANQKMAGLETRDQAKTFIYALIYGAGPAKMGKIVGKGKSAGQKMINDYLDAVPALRRLRKKIDKASADGMIKAIDGRLLNIRSQHSALNTLLQGMGAIVCKYWLIEIIKRIHKHKLDAKLVASIHDEYQFDVHKDCAEDFAMHTNKAIKDVEIDLDLRCPLDSDYKIGNNWCETH
jgi:DNA polymerase I